MVRSSKGRARLLELLTRRLTRANIAIWHTPCPPRDVSRARNGSSDQKTSERESHVAILSASGGVDRPSVVDQDTARTDKPRLHPGLPLNARMKTHNETPLCPAMSRGRYHATRFAVFASAALFVALVSACTEPIPPIPADTVSFGRAADSVLAGKTYQLVAVVRDAGGREITGRNVTFTSNAPSIAEPDANGLVTAKAAGSAEMKATIDGKTDLMTLKVLLVASRLVVTPATNDVSIGATRGLLATLTSITGEAIPGRTVTWQSSNAAVATVNGAGVVSAVSLGTAIITGTGDLDGVSGTSSFTVTDPVATVRLTPAIAQIIRLGGSLQMTATALNAAGQPLTGRTVNWVSGNTGFATVSVTGVVTPVGVGSTNITAEIEGRTAQLGITVTAIPPQSVTITPDTLRLSTPSQRQIIPVVIDTTGAQVISLANRNVVWDSDNDAVATVGVTSGVITAVGGGVARINVTVDGFRSNDIVVLVTTSVSSVRITPFLTQTVRVGGSVQLTATPLDNNNQPVPGKTVNWFTNNSTVATVSASGLVSGIGVGSTVITAEVDLKTATLTVNVTLVPIATVTLAPLLDTMAVTDVRQYILVVRDTANRVVTNFVGRSVNWQSSNSFVANVTNQGVVTASSVGASQISVSVDTANSGILQLTVSEVESVTLTPSPTATVKVGQTLQLTVTMKDGAGRVLTVTRPGFVTFGSSAGGIAAVSSFGLVSGLAPGTATITASARGLPKQVAVTVTP